MRNLPGLTALVVVLVMGGARAAEDWEKVADGDVAIKARKRPDIPGGREVWAEGHLDVSIQDVQSALRDHESFRHWMPYVTESKVVSHEPDGRVTYTQLDFPIISNRDYVLRVVDEELLAADGTGVFRQRWFSQGKALPERSGVVRLYHNEGSWHFTPAGESRVRFIYRFTVEPGGSIPGFLAGVGQKDAVMDTVRAVEKRARKLATERASAR
ncbi:SRPBCC family protein [Archangium violaceum]|uniref:SRPBCC family protein n=1 Tax=Archangium violaceum TaxID=83451 RepID=UPI00194EB870|nr:SRPBCC family protein [Archangium violaceum]QRN98216.1 SRPBCC family protein [Archangium violaceum]